MTRRVIRQTSTTRPARRPEWCAWLALALILPYLHLLQLQARPFTDVLLDLHASGSCCSSEQPANVAVDPRHADAPTGESPAPPWAASCCAADEVAEAVAQAPPEDHDAGCCCDSSASCACHHAAPGGIAWLAPPVGLPLPSARTLAGHFGRDHVREGGLAPPEQPPKA